MITHPTITELALWGVTDRGQANKECIAICATEDVDLGRFGVMVGTKNAGVVQPFRDQMFWFGQHVLKAGAWIFVYTGGGEASVQNGEGGVPMFRLYWGKDRTMFANSTVVPIIFRVDAIAVGAAPIEQPQIGYQQIAQITRLGDI